MKKLKCYIFIGEYDGKQQNLIIAYNKKEAAKVAQIDLYSFNLYWSKQNFGKNLIKELKPNVLYVKKFDAYELNGVWVKANLIRE
jgi:hypothetical protein